MIQLGLEPWTMQGSDRSSIILNRENNTLSTTDNGVMRFIVNVTFTNNQSMIDTRTV